MAAFGRYNEGRHSQLGPSVYRLIADNPGISFTSIDKYMGECGTSTVKTILDRLERFDLIRGNLKKSQLVGSWFRLNQNMGAYEATDLVKLIKFGEWKSVKSAREDYWSQFMEDDLDLCRDVGWTPSEKARSQTKRYWIIPADDALSPARDTHIDIDLEYWCKYMADPINAQPIGEVNPLAIPSKVRKMETTHDKATKQLIKDVVWTRLKGERNNEFINTFAYWAVFCSTIGADRKNEITPENVIEKWYEEWKESGRDSMRIPLEVKCFEFFAEGFNKMDFAY